MSNHTCQADNCERDVHIKKRGLCKYHYRKWWALHGGTMNIESTRQCKRCNEAFTTKAHDRLYCSPKCRRTHGRATNPNPCMMGQCQRNHHSRGMCKMHYKQWARANGMETPPSDQWGDQRRNNYQARRAMMRGARNGDTVLLADIIKRDGTHCAWCNKNIDVEITWPHKMSKSIDHILPISRGGEHTLDNTRILHFSCNSSRGNRAHDLQHEGGPHP